MNKEYLEALEFMFNEALFSEFKNETHTKVRECHSIVYEALQRLEQIDNSNPSKALRELSIIRHLEIGFDENGNAVTVGDCTGFNAIKQALLKQQEPKQYLKWEDLEFKTEEQTMEVILNGNGYTLKYCKLKDYDVDRIRLVDKNLYTYLMLHTSTRQIFNDLRLEKVEE